MRFALVKTKSGEELINPQQITRVMTMVNLSPDITQEETKVMMSDGSHFFVNGTALEFVHSI